MKAADWQSKVAAVAAAAGRLAAYTVEGERSRVVWRELAVVAVCYTAAIQQEPEQSWAGRKAPNSCDRSAALSSGSGVVMWWYGPNLRSAEACGWRCRWLLVEARSTPANVWAPVAASRRSVVAPWVSSAMSDDNCRRCTSLTID